MYIETVLKNFLENHLLRPPFNSQVYYKENCRHLPYLRNLGKFVNNWTTTSDAIALTLDNFPFLFFLSGFTGENCSINVNECDTKPCLRNSTCIDLINKFKCECEAGYFGERCEFEIDECLSNPCMSNASCIDKVLRGLFRTISNNYGGVFLWK